MKNRINKSLFIVIVGVLIFATAGCGKKSEPEIPSNEEQVVATEEVTPAPEPEITEEPAEETDPVIDFWDGDWFGYMWVEYAEGGLAEWSNCYWDAMATIHVEDNGDADMLFWYESLSRENPAGHVQLKISPDSGSGEMGAALSESGWIFVDSDTGNGDVHHADWIIDPMTDPTSCKFGNDMIHFYGDYVEGDGGLSYHFFLRKWGKYWDDVAKDEEELIPRGYEMWYKPLIEEGYAMPNNIGDDGSVKMGENITASAGDTEPQDKAPIEPETTGGYQGGDLVLVDDEYCKITVKGTGSNPYNDAWIGYVMEIVNKKDYTIYFTSYADPDLNEQSVSNLGKGNTCYYAGELTPTHMGYNVNAGATISDACLAIDGVTDVSQLGNVRGYISVSNNETGEVLNNVEYSF